MGLQLKLLIMNNTSATCVICRDMIALEENSIENTFEKLQEAANEKGRDVIRGGIRSHYGRISGAGKDWDGEKCWGDTEFDAYGDRLKSLLAPELAEVISQFDLSSDWKWRATLAFLKELPAKLPIFLYWD